jgi:hypothetical protein
LLFDIVDWYCQAENIQTPDTIEGQVALILQNAPKIEAHLQLVKDRVVLGKEKCTLFCTIPGQEIIIFAILNALKIKAAVYHADLLPEQKQAL